MEVGVVGRGMELAGQRMEVKRGVSKLQQKWGGGGGGEGCVVYLWFMDNYGISQQLHKKEEKKTS
jgi:hypothetical protein